MHSMIGNRFGTFPHQSSIHMYSSYNVSITTKPYHLYHFSAKSHLSFSHSSFSLPRSSRRGLLDQHNLGNITFRVGHPSTSLTDQNSSHLQAFFTADHFKEVVLVAKELERSGYKDVAKKLMKLHKPEDIVPGDATDWKKNMELLEIMIDEEMFHEALEYSDHVKRNISSYKQPVDMYLFNNMKFVIFCGLEHHDAANRLRGNMLKAKLLGQDQNVAAAPTATTPRTTTETAEPTAPTKEKDGSEGRQDQKVAAAPTATTPTAPAETTAPTKEKYGSDGGQDQNVAATPTATTPTTTTAPAETTAPTKEKDGSDGGQDQNVAATPTVTIPTATTAPAETTAPTKEKDGSDGGQDQNVAAAPTATTRTMTPAETTAPTKKTDGSDGGQDHQE